MAWGPISIAGSVSGYTLPTATKDVLGGVKTGENITNKGGVISLIKENVIAALGFTPANSTHTHNYAGSGSAGGSATSAVKLDTATAGTATKPVYFSGGKPVACTYELKKTVPSDAIFTDHTYSAMKGATASAAGVAGLVPAPAKGAQDKVLSGAGTYIDVYTKDQVDALQEQVKSGTVKPVVVWTGQLYTAKTYTLPETVDYLTIWGGEGEGDNKAPQYLLPGETVTFYGYSKSTATFNTNHTLTIKNGGDLGGNYFVGYHYETYAEDTKVPQLVAVKTIKSANNAQSMTVGTDVDCIVLRWSVASGTGSINYLRYMTLIRGVTPEDKWYLFTSAGKLTVPTTQYFYNGIYDVICYHYATAAELSAQLTSAQSALADADALNLDQDYRLTLLELGVTDDETTE